MNVIPDILDVNCMIGRWPGKATRFEDRPGLIDWLDRYRIGSAVTYCSDALWNPPRGNEVIASEAEQSDGRLLRCLVLQPTLGLPGMGTLAEVETQLRTIRPAAVRLCPNTHKYPLDSFYAGPLLDLLNRLRLPVLLAPEETPGYDRLPELAQTYPDLPLALLRRPLNEARTLLPLLAQTANIYLDMSILIDTGLIEELARRGLADRLVFGSNLPFHEPSGGLGLVSYARIDDHARRSILGENFRRVMEEIRWT